ncbi:MAG: class I SAM-dependent methyltransferase [Candidatus Edwardsbacteria bacterium]|nr:class I SAM-dependent methyltransferase [Candidatus Edwardsbacteria bacterium]
MPTANVFLDRSILGSIRRTGAKTVCDYGCGEGALLKRLGQRTAHRLRLIGIDYFSARPKSEQPENSGNIVFIDRASSEYKRLAARGNAFDLIVSTFTLHHFKRPVEDLTNLKKLLKPRGTLFLADLAFKNNSDSQTAKNLCSFLSEEFHAFQGKYHRHHYTVDEARSLFDAAGFTIERAHSVTIDFPASERKEETAHAMENLGRMRSANRKSGNAVQRAYFNRRFEAMGKLVRRYGIDYSQLLAITARKQ